MPGSSSQSSYNRSRTSNSDRSNGRRRRTNINYRPSTKDHEEDSGFRKLPSDTAPAYRLIETKRKLRGSPRNFGPSPNPGQVRAISPKYKPENQHIKEESQASDIECSSESKESKNLGSKLKQHLINTNFKSSPSELSSPFTFQSTLGKVPEIETSKYEIPNLKMVANVNLEWQHNEIEAPGQIGGCSVKITSDAFDIDEKNYADSSLPLRRPPPGLPLPNNPPRSLYINTTTSSSSVVTPTQVSTSLQRQLPKPSENDTELYDHFLKLVDVETRFLNDRLETIHYSPELSSRLQSDFEVIDAAYEKVSSAQNLAHSPLRLLYNALLALKKATEQRNHDARVLGALKEMAQNYDQMRTTTAHEKWVGGDKPLNPEEMQEMGDISRRGEKLMDTLRWNINGGDDC